MIKALVFDFDGTIIDTESAWYAAFREAYEQHGVELSVKQYSQCIGTSLCNFNPYEYLMTDLSLPIDREEFRKAVQQRHSELMEAEEMRLGIKHYLDSAKAAGLKIGLATSSSTAWVEKYLKQLGLREYFDCIRTADHVKNVKPDPELYLQALDCLGVKPDEAIAIEDSPNGSKAALAAGMHCIISPNKITSLLDFDPSLYRVACFTDLDFDHLTTRLFETTQMS
ncbi:HAD family hydrolase [Paenibacillus sabinae]|uniref:Phosphoglycolate phosphatase n=1 Tax=Paenibacillus sabinae T27 TaxID=1268072 RepID=X4ZYM4_9BACL|nr:HAD family hydrolase [Paenibacillus sabinae]AHV97278.1 hypothetical protein PSAB_11750 [Paenibacillus sabinae T27]